MIFTEHDKNVNLRRIFNDSIFTAFLELESMSLADIDTLMSFIPETCFQTMSIGSACIGNDGKTFNSLGFIKSSDVKNEAHRQAIFSKTSKSCLSPHMSALYFDSTNPGRQDVMQVRLNEAVPLLDLEQPKAQLAAQKSIFMDIVKLESLLVILLQ